VVKMKQKAIYLNRLEDIYQRFLPLQDAVRGVYQSDPEGSALRYFAEMLDKFEELLRVEARLIDEYYTSEEEMGRSVKGVVKAWVMIQGHLSFERAERKENHGW